MPKRRGGGAEFVDALPEDGERRLMLAVLIDAIRALTPEESATRQSHASRAWLRDRAWLQAEDPSSPFSFVSICNALGLDADYVRRCVLRPTTQRLTRVHRYAAKVEESWLRQRRKRGKDGFELKRALVAVLK